MSIDQAQREELVIRYQDYARSLAMELGRTLPAMVSRDDLVSAANEGLVVASHRFDPRRGTPFKTFCYYRVRGAIFDHIRELIALDPVVRARVNAADAVDTMIEQNIASASTDTNEEQMYGVLEFAATAFTVSSCAVALMSEQAMSFNDGENVVLMRDEILRIRKAVDTLPERERRLVGAMYFEGHSLEEVGAMLQLSKSWASRLHTHALELLRVRLSASAGR